jgi:NADH-quinone oxidoreductase subunit I
VASAYRSIFGSARGFFASIFSGSRSVVQALSVTIPYLLGRGEQQKQITEQYPDPISSRTEDDLPQRTRGVLVNDIHRCTGCGECVTACPAAAINMTAEPGATAEKRWVSVFDIDYGRCILCGLCVEVCGPASLTHSRGFEFSQIDRNRLVHSFGSGPVTEGQRKKWERMREMEEEDF